MDWVNITKENIADEHLCCIIRSKKPHPGIEAKREWLAGRIDEGHILRKLDIRGCVFIEYAPLEKAWVPIVGENFYYIYCLWVQGAPKGCGYGRQLMEYCLADARAHGKAGVCMLGAQKQKNWLSDQRFAKKHGFCTVDTTPDGYELLTLSFDGTTPRFAPSVRQETAGRGLVVYYDYQCPYIPQRVEKLRSHCAEKGIPARFILVDTLEKAKSLPCVFKNWAVLWDGKFVTVNQLDGAAIDKIAKQKLT